ncbi:hypothetical protein FW320_01730 [Azospirillum sp. Vi22]|uniref:hypothetical protein n=1 Tax=Azospirillum baldaniorum TaxID=1064539 RepID=UPI00157B37D1|nr:hypothetical protein [Azospirillum baldaniorum]NUB04913.1 hypothetical protein [Azospirillum baldaniorum]
MISHEIDTITDIEDRTLRLFVSVRSSFCDANDTCAVDAETCPCQNLVHQLLPPSDLMHLLGGEA